MSQQPPPPPYAAPAPDGREAPTVSFRTSAAPGPPPPLHHGGTPAGPGTDTMAILSIVFAFLFSPLGIVFGLIGRRRTRRTGQPGRGLATVGLALSVVFLVVGVGATLYVTVLAVPIAPSVRPRGAR